MIEPFT